MNASLIAAPALSKKLENIAVNAQVDVFFGKGGVSPLHCPKNLQAHRPILHPLEGDLFHPDFSSPSRLSRIFFRYRS